MRKGYHGDPAEDGRIAARRDSQQKPVARLVGQDGNIFNLLGIARRALIQAGQREQAAEVLERVGGCGAYHEALAIIGEYVDIQ